MNKKWPQEEKLEERQEEEQREKLEEEDDARIKASVALSSYRDNSIEIERLAL